MFFCKKKADKGYSVKLRGRSKIFYSEGGRQALISCELMGNPSYISIYFSIFEGWMPPFDNESISDDDKDRIKRNVTIEIESLGKVIDWE